MFQMRSLYFALNILMILISNASATKCGVIVPECENYLNGNGIIQWEKLKQCPLYPICERGFKLLSDNFNGKTKCCCHFGNIGDHYMGADEACEKGQLYVIGSFRLCNKCAPGYYNVLVNNHLFWGEYFPACIDHCPYEKCCWPGQAWGHALKGCVDPSDTLSSEVPCPLPGCDYNNMAYNSNGECVCCPEYTFWNILLQKCTGSCDYEIEGCMEGEITNVLGTCKCNKCLPGYSMNTADPTISNYQPCIKTCDWVGPCIAGKEWSYNVCGCVDIPPTSDIQPTSDIPSSSAIISSPDIPSSGVPCLLHVCEYNNMAYKNNGECVCCPEFSHWDDSLQKCFLCFNVVEDCTEIEMISNTGYCKCNKCLPGFFKNPVYSGETFAPQCTKTCNWVGPCVTGKEWSYDLCNCVDIPTTSDIPPSFDAPSPSNSPSSGISS